MTHFELKLQTALKLDAIATIVYDCADGKHQQTKSDYHLGGIDYSDWTKFSPRIEPTEYRFTFDLPLDAVIDENTSKVQFGYIGSRGYFVGPGVLKEYYLSEIPGELKSSFTE